VKRRPEIPPVPELISSLVPGELDQIPTLPLFPRNIVGELVVSSVHCVISARGDPFVPILAQLDVACDLSCRNASEVPPLAVPNRRLVFQSTTFNLYAGVFVPIPSLPFALSQNRLLFEVSPPLAVPNAS